MGNIDWIPIADIPDDWKDGRDVLLWAPSGAEVGNWTDENFEGRPGWNDRGECLPIENVTHCAEITPP